MNHIELGKKLLALAEKGIGGEKENAKKMLDDLMKKHSISIDDLTDNISKQREFVVKEKSHHKILAQIIFKVLNVNSIKYGESKNGKKAFADLTDYQFLEVSMLYDFYIKIFDEVFYLLICVLWLSSS